MVEGLLDNEKSALTLQKEQLKLDIARFELRSEQLSSMITMKDSQKTALQKQIFYFEIQKKDLVSKIAALNSQVGSETNERSKDKQFYQDELTRQYRNVNFKDSVIDSYHNLLWKEKKE